MIVAVTGGTGFIGSALVDQLLHDGNEVRVLTRNASYDKYGATPVLGDLLDESIELNEFVQDVDVLYHCCGELSDKTKMRKLHVDGIKKLLQTAEGNVGRWVQLSSVGVFGRCRSGMITEESPENPIGEYERTKTESDHLVKSSGIPCTILRPSTVFGRGMPNQSLHQLIRAMTTGRFFYIGKRGAILNYVHVNDVVRALVLCGSVERAFGNAFNISQSIEIETMAEGLLSNQPTRRTIWRLPELPIRVLASGLGWLKMFPLSSSRIDTLTGRHIYDSSKIQQELDFEFGATLKEHFKSFSDKK